MFRLIKKRSCNLLCVLKIIIVINQVCECVRTSVEDNDFQRLSKGG